MAWKFAFDKHNRNRNGYNVILSSLKLVLHVRVSGQKLLPCGESLVQSAVCEHRSLGSFLFSPRIGCCSVDLSISCLLDFFPANCWSVLMFYSSASMPSSCSAPRLSQLLPGRTRGACTRLGWRLPITGTLPRASVSR